MMGRFNACSSVLNVPGASIRLQVLQYELKAIALSLPQIEGARSIVSQ